MSKQGYYLTGLKLISAGIFILALEQAALAVLRACPNGCSLSSGCEASLKPTSVIIDDDASVRLFTPSAIMAILDASHPIAIFITQRRKFVNIPTVPASFA